MKSIPKKGENFHIGKSFKHPNYTDIMPKETKEKIKNEMKSLFLMTVSNCCGRKLGTSNQQLELLFHLSTRPRQQLGQPVQMNKRNWPG